MDVIVVDGVLWVVDEVVEVASAFEEDDADTTRKLFTVFVSDGFDTSQIGSFAVYRDVSGNWFEETHTGNDDMPAYFRQI